MKYIMIASVFLLINLNCYSVTPECKSKDWKLSKMEFSPDDPYLITVLGFSYGPAVRKFIPKLSGAISRYYFEGDQLNSKFTFFSTYYAEASDAKEAFEHLKMRTKGISLQDVEARGKQIIWYAGRDISTECFKSVRLIVSKDL